MKRNEKGKNRGKVNPEHKNVVTYQKDVEQILTDTESSYTVIPQGDMLMVSIPKNENMQQIKSGKVIILPKKNGTDNQLALKVKGVTDTGNGIPSSMMSVPACSCVRIISCILSKSGIPAVIYVINAFLFCSFNCANFSSILFMLHLLV